MLLLVFMTICGALAAGRIFAAGVLCSGGVMLGSLFLSAWLTRPDADGRLDHRRVPILFTLKFPLVGLGILVLLNRFPVLSVVLGGAVPVAAILLDTLVRIPTRAGEA